MSYSEDLNMILDKYSSKRRDVEYKKILRDIRRFLKGELTKLVKKPRTKTSQALIKYMDQIVESYSEKFDVKSLSKYTIIALIYSKVYLKNPELMSSMGEKSEMILNEKLVSKFDSALNNFSKKKMRSLFNCPHFMGMFNLYLIALKQGAYKSDIPDHLSTISAMVYMCKKQGSEVNY